MKKYLSIIVFCILIVFSHASQAKLEKGKWNFTKDTDYCYIGSIPQKIDLPEGKIRGDTYILVYRINNSNEAIVQIDAGYLYKEGKDVIVKIDNSLYKFYVEADTAWTNDDKAVIYAMKKGIELRVIGESSRGTVTNDLYSLRGFTVAFNKLLSDC
jgi:hypothetical protein